MPIADPRPLLRARPLHAASRAGCLALLLAACVTPSAHADELKPFSVTYIATYHGLTVAQATLTLAQRDPNTWVYRSIKESRGIARMFSTAPAQESVMRVTASGVQPMSYREFTGTPPTPKDVKLSFDWDSGHVTGSYQNAPLDAAVPPGTQDKMSQGIALVQTLIHGQTPGDVVLLDDKVPHHYHYVREKEEVLDTKIGKVPTIVFKRTKTEGPETSRFWLAPGYGFVPMKVEQKEDGGTEYSLLVTTIQR